MIARLLLIAASLTVLAGCERQTTDKAVLAKAEANQSAAADDAGRILCAHGDVPLARDCTVDRVQGADGLILTVAHPDGAFHRLLVVKDGRGVVAADGAQKAEVAIVGPNTIDVTLAGDRYQLPATVRSASAAGR